ncbi:hypothetical protein ACJX0J_020441, partial [Zea mays]
YMYAPCQMKWGSFACFLFPKKATQMRNTVKTHPSIVTRKTMETAHVQTIYLSFDVAKLIGQQQHQEFLDEIELYLTKCYIMVYLFKEVLNLYNNANHEDKIIGIYLCAIVGDGTGDSRDYIFKIHDGVFIVNEMFYFKICLITKRVLFMLTTQK